MKRLTKKRSRAFASSAGLFLAAAFLGGCVLGPNYKRPESDMPDTFRPADTETMDLSDTNSLGDLDWRLVFKDPQLQDYISEALTNNWDIKIAAARVLQAEAVARVTRSQFFPTVGVGGEWASVRSSEKGLAPVPASADPEQDYQSVYAFMTSYELDLWGRIRRANEAALARLLATESAQRTVRQTLVAEIATVYFNLLELDHELDISQKTYEVRTNSLVLTTAREEGGVASLQDVFQARILVASAEVVIVDTLRRIEQTENELSILLGRNPGAPRRGDAFLLQEFDDAVPPGLPSALVERRPDIQSAEQQLVAANADIGQAKAAFFPQLTLTGAFGYQSLEFSDLFKSSARTWQFGPSVSLPLFTGGALEGRLKFARAAFEESLAQYQKTVQNSFREVSDNLIAYKRSREYRAYQERNTQAHRDAAELANTRYEGGVTSYLEVLYNEQELFDSELILAQTRLSELLSVVALYRSLGGGWQVDKAEVQK